MPTVVPIKDQNRGWRFWHKNEIYTGPAGPGRMVPNVEDGVWSWTDGLWRVDSVNYTTGLSVLEPHSFDNYNGGVVEEDVLLSTGPSRQSESYRIYIDDTAAPYTMVFDARLHVYGSAAHHMKVFRGTDISLSTGQVISAYYNNVGAYVDDNVPLELSYVPGGTNQTIKNPKVASTNESLSDGEVVTAVVYSDTNMVLSVYRMLVAKTNYIATANLGQRFIMSVELDTSFLSPSNDKLILLPGNMLLDSTVLTGIVHYSDGSDEVLPVDGGRFKLLGLDNYVGHGGGQDIDLVLKYSLLSNEYAYAPMGALPDRWLTMPYKLRTVEDNSTYTVKLFVVPVWDTTSLPQWKLTYWLYSLTRDVVFDVTSLVQPVVGQPAFDPNNLNGRQALRVALNLADIPFGGYMSYRKVQDFAITLKAPGSNTAATNYWMLEYTTGNIYGSGQFAVGSLEPSDSSKRRLDISLGYTDVGDWLNHVYWPTQPLFKNPEELSAPTPTHVRVKFGPSFVRELEVWEALQYVGMITPTFTQGTIVHLEFIKREFDGDKELGISSMVIRV